MSFRSFPLTRTGSLIPRQGPVPPRSWGLAPRAADAVEVNINVTWHHTPAFVDCGQNLERIGCRHCGAEIDTDWWGDFMDAYQEGGFATLAVEVPCCGAATTLESGRRWSPLPALRGRPRPRAGNGAEPVPE
jgi:hypothetical protein